MKKGNEFFINISLWIGSILLISRLIIGWNDFTECLIANNYIKLIYTLFGFISETISLTALLLWMFNNWLWKFKWINKITGNIPVLDGDYSGYLISTYDSRKKKRDLEVSIKQTYLKTIVKTKTKESSSISLDASFWTIDEDVRLIYTFFNEPKATFRQRSDMHYGTAELHVVSHNELEGNYYTDRKTTGEIVLKRKI